MISHIFYAHLQYEIINQIKIIEKKYPKNKYMILDMGKKYRPVSKRYRIIKERYIVL